MAKRKHQFHCQKCGSECQVYKKGKKHRVLVCPRCGVLATNPFSLGGAATGATTGAAIGSIFPGVGTAIGAGVGGLIGAFSGKPESPSSPEAQKPIVVTHQSGYPLRERVHDALR